MEKIRLQIAPDVEFKMDLDVKESIRAVATIVSSNIKRKFTRSLNGA